MKKLLSFEKLIVYSCAVMASLFWGWSYVWFKQVNKIYGPVTIITLRLVIANIFLSLLLAIARKHQKIRKEDRKYFFLLALLQPFLYFFFESVGLTMVTATAAAIIVATIPVFTPVFTHFFSREHFGLWLATGLILSFIGVFMVVRSDGHDSNSILGILLMSGAVASAIVYGLLLKKVSIHYSSLNIVQFQNLIGLFYFLPFFLVFEGKQFWVAPHSVEIFSILIRLGVMPSTLSFIFITYTIKRIGLINTNIFANLIPVFTAMIAFYVLQEALPVQKVVGIIVVICGLLISQIPQFKQFRKRASKLYLKRPSDQT